MVLQRRVKIAEVELTWFGHVRLERNTLLRINASTYIRGRAMAETRTAKIISSGKDGFFFALRPKVMKANHSKDNT